MRTFVTAALGRMRNSRARQAGRLLTGMALAAGAGGLLGGCARSGDDNRAPERFLDAQSNLPWQQAGKGWQPDGHTHRRSVCAADGGRLENHDVDTKDEAFVVAERALEPGEVLKGDISVKGGKKQPTVTAVNDVTVQKIAPGVFNIRNDSLEGADAQACTGCLMVAAFKKALPPTLATEANARSLAAQSIRDLWHVTFGPGDPLISQLSSLLSSPELMERRVQQRIGSTLEQHIEAKFGAEVTAAQKRDIAAASFTVLCST